MDGQVFREVEWQHEGVTVRCTPSLAMLRRMKAQGVNVLQAAKGCLHGNADVLDLAACHSIMSGVAGVQATDEQSYAFLMSGDETAILSWQMAFVEAVMPGVDLGKKPAAPAKKTRKKKTPTRK